MRAFKAYLPVLIWMGVIFSASTDLGSTKHSSRFIGPLLRWFNPAVREETIHAVQVIVRKGGHLTEYAILALLFWRAGRKLRPERPLLQNWSWREVGWIVLWCGLYAITDELHQTFVATRQGHPGDVLIDTIGAFCGLLMIWMLGRWKKRW